MYKRQVHLVADDDGRVVGANLGTGQHTGVAAVSYTHLDNLFRFWYRFVPQYATPLQAGRQEEIARLIEERHLPIYLGPAFEDVCRQWLLREMGTSRVPLILDIGRWWGNDPGRREQAEIDIVALCDEGEVLFAECKWREKPTDVDVLETLKHRSQLIPAEKRLLDVYKRQEPRQYRPSMTSSSAFMTCRSSLQRMPPVVDRNHGVHSMP